MLRAYTCNRDGIILQNKTARQFSSHLFPSKGSTAMGIMRMRGTRHDRHCPFHPYFQYHYIYIYIDMYAYYFYYYYIKQLMFVVVVVVVVGWTVYFTVFKTLIIYYFSSRNTTSAIKISFHFLLHSRLFDLISKSSRRRNSSSRYFFLFFFSGLTWKINKIINY